MTETRRVRSVDLDDPFRTDLTGMCELLLVRHGEQRFFNGMTMGEAYDPPLTDLGEAQARLVGERLAGVHIDAVYCSNMQRAHRTGQEIARHHGLEPTVREELREIDLWETFPRDKVLADVYSNRELAEIFSAAHTTRRWDSYPHTEDPAQFRARVIGTIDEIAARHVGHRVAIACHGGVIGQYLAHCLASTYDNPIAVHHTSVTTIRAADHRRVVLTVNDYSHVLAVQTERNPLNAH